MEDAIRVRSSDPHDASPARHVTDGSPLIHVKPSTGPSGIPDPRVRIRASATFAHRSGGRPGSRSRHPPGEIRNRPISRARRRHGRGAGNGRINDHDHGDHERSRRGPRNRRIRGVRSVGGGRWAIVSRFVYDEGRHRPTVDIARCPLLLRSCVAGRRSLTARSRPTGIHVKHPARPDDGCLDAARGGGPAAKTRPERPSWSRLWRFVVAGQVSVDRTESSPQVRHG